MQSSRLGHALSYLVCDHEDLMLAVGSTASKGVCMVNWTSGFAINPILELLCWCSLAPSATLAKQHYNYVSTMLKVLTTLFVGFDVLLVQWLLLPRVHSVSGAGLHAALKDLMHEESVYELRVCGQSIRSILWPCIWNLEWCRFRIMLLVPNCATQITNNDNMDDVFQQLLLIHPTTTTMVFIWNLFWMGSMCCWCSGFIYHVLHSVSGAWLLAALEDLRHKESVYELWGCGQSIHSILAMHMVFGVVPFSQLCLWCHAVLRFLFPERSKARNQRSMIAECNSKYVTRKSLQLWCAIRVLSMRCYVVYAGCRLD